VELQIPTEAYVVVERLSVLEWNDGFKVHGNMKDVRRTGCPTTHQPDKNEERMWKFVHVNRRLIVQGTAMYTEKL
jgi:hypothetical protein